MPMLLAAGHQPCDLSGLWPGQVEGQAEGEAGVRPAGAGEDALPALRHRRQRGGAAGDAGLPPQDAAPELPDRGAGDLDPADPRAGGAVGVLEVFPVTDGSRVPFGTRGYRPQDDKQKQAPPDGGRS